MGTTPICAAAISSLTSLIRPGHSTRLSMPRVRHSLSRGITYLPSPWPQMRALHSRSVSLPRACTSMWAPFSGESRPMYNISGGCPRVRACASSGAAGSALCITSRLMSRRSTTPLMNSDLARSDTNTRESMARYSASCFALPALTRWRVHTMLMRRWPWHSCRTFTAMAASLKLWTCMFTGLLPGKRRAMRAMCIGENISKAPPSRITAGSNPASFIGPRTSAILRQTMATLLPCERRAVQRSRA